MVIFLNSKITEKLITLFLGGITIHSAFDLKFGSGKDKNGNYLPLSSEKLVNFRNNLSDLKLIIIDEISLVNPDIMYLIHLRLGEIWPEKKKLPFADVSVIAVGDLMQVIILWRFYHQSYLF